MNVNGFNRGAFQSMGGPPSVGSIGDLWVTTDGDFTSHNLFLAVAPGTGSPGFSDSQERKTPRLFQQGGIAVKNGPAANLPKFATVGVVLVTTDTLQAFLGLGASAAIYQFNLDVPKVLNSGLITQSFSASDPVLVPTPSGPVVPISLFDLNG